MRRTFGRKCMRRQGRAMNCCHARSGNGHRSHYTCRISVDGESHTMSSMTIESPPFVATAEFTDAHSAIARLEEIYERNTRFLRDRFEAYLNGDVLTARVRATYPFVRITTQTHAR